MSLEVGAEALSRGDERKHELLRHRVPLLGVQEDFADVVYWSLGSLVVSYQHRADCRGSDREVQIQWLSCHWPREDGGCGEVFLQLGEGSLAVLVPLYPPGGLI